MNRAVVGYAAMLEQFAPNEVLELAALAEQHGFQGVMAADHFQPWTPQQGQASFVWNILSALGQLTKGALGTVSTPTYRAHPAVVAQASATLESMYPGRHWLGLGSGEALNEHVVGQYWPDAPERIDRMFEALDIIRKLFTSGATGKDTRHEGRYYRLESTRLWTAPATPPPIYVAASGPVTARRAGRVADGIITETAPHEKLAALFQRFDEGAKENGRKTGERILRVHVSWAPTHEEATRNALEQWPTLGLKFPKADIRSPFEIEQMARMVTPAHFEGRLLISSDPDEHRTYLQGFLDLGVDRIHLHNVGRNQAEFLEVFGRDVLPGLTR
jgi:coenzyme F420-dependent glucose-6-phosphate dehydrogenase